MFTGLSGQGGAIRVGGRVAATVTDWAVTAAPGENVYDIRAGLADVQPTYLNPSYRAEVRLQMTKRQWRWRDCTFAVAGERLTARAVGGPDVL